MIVTVCRFVPGRMAEPIKARGMVRETPTVTTEFESVSQSPRMTVVRIQEKVAERERCIRCHDRTYPMTTLRGRARFPQQLDLPNSRIGVVLSMARTYR